MTNPEKLERPPLEYFLNLKYPISIYPEDKGGYTAMIPDLSGYMTQGKRGEKLLLILRKLVSYG
jgi:hypothetical protein